MSAENIPSNRDYRRLLLSLCLLGVLYPLLDPTIGVGYAGLIGWTAAFWITLFAGLRALHVRRLEMRIARTLMALAIALGVLTLLYGIHEDESSRIRWGIHIAADLVTIAFLMQTTYTIVLDVVSSGRVDENRIWGSVCVYILLGLTFGYVYALLGLLLPNTLVTVGAVPGLPAEQMDSLATGLYFSFVTLTTLGYGEIAPGNHVSRLLAPTEAIVGQLYLTVLVARLVGLHISHRHVERDRT